MIEVLTPELIERARSHVAFRLREPDERGCRIWDGPLLKSGYGNAYIGSRTDKSRKRVRAHRLAWELHHGTPVPVGMMVLHSCDVKRCCEPEHLHLGDQFDNMREMVERGRAVFGDRSKAAKLNPEKVQLLWALHEKGWTQEAIANHLGITRTPVRLTLAGRSWSWVPRVAPAAYAPQP